MSSQSGSCRIALIVVALSLGYLPLAVAPANSTFASNFRNSETTRYSKFRPCQVSKCKPLADMLYEMCHDKQKLKRPPPPSLLETCELYPRLRRP